MKKKTLLLTLLALAIVTSLTAGTLAVYTKTLSVDATVETKKFKFSVAGGTQETTSKIKLAPTQSQKFGFTVTNANGNDFAEVPLDFKVVIDIKEAADNMLGLSPKLTRNGNAVALTEGDGVYSFSTPEGVPMLPGAKHEDLYMLTLTWENDNANSGSHTVVGENPITKPMKISVTATQNTAKNIISPAN